MAVLTGRGGINTLPPHIEVKTISVPPKKVNLCHFVAGIVLIRKLMQAQHADLGRGADDLGKLLHGVHHAGGAHTLFQPTVIFVVFHL